jgi:putative nucleotidyltransferase with HDIG domain/diguanylate cyclase (GGDEF)-like protein
MASSELRASAKIYVSAVVLAGAAAIADSFYQLYTRPVDREWAILALLTLGTGSATVRLPSVPATITVSETFVFASVLLFGAAAGTLTVTLDALVISFWLARKGVPLYRVLFNVGVLPVAMWVGSHLFYSLAGVPPLSVDATPVRQLLWPLFVFTITYFLLNSGLIAIAIALDKGGSPFRIWRENFAWLSVNYFCGASVAMLLGSYAKNLDFTSLALIIPLLLVLYLTFTASMGRVEDANRHLSQLNSLYMSTIETLAMAIDAKDQITHGHIRRVQHYAVSLAKAAGIREEAQLRAIEAAALLHDMGKLAVPEYILNKPSALTPAEFEKMKLHASVGADILSSIEFPYPVVPIVRHHHENWDGSGYPDGLKGAEIPIGARVLSVVDCFDALTSDRPYRPRLSDVDALKILEERRGRMYDPLVVDCFLRIHADLSERELPAASNRTAFAAITEASQPAIVSNEVSRLEDISASTEEMLTLYELAKGLSGHTALDDAGDVIFKHLRRILPASTCVFFVYDVETDELVAAHASGEHSHAFQGLRIVLGQRLTGWVAANRQTILNSDPVLDLGEVSRNLRPRLRSCLSTPLLVRTELVGVLSVYSTARDSFSEDHRRIVESISGQVAQTVRQSLDYEISRTSRLRDGVTGLPQLEHVKHLVSSAASGEAAYPFSLILVRVDDLSVVTSELGLPNAHGLLERVAASMRKVLSSADVLCRSSSDQEFVALLLNTDSQTCFQVASRLDSTLKSEVLGTRESSQGHHFARISHATAPQDGPDVEDLLSLSRQRIQPPTSKNADPPHDKRKSIH